MCFGTINKANKIGALSKYFCCLSGKTIILKHHTRQTKLLFGVNGWRHVEKQEEILCSQVLSWHLRIPRWRRLQRKTSGCQRCLNKSVYYTANPGCLGVLCLFSLFVVFDTNHIFCICWLQVLCGLTWQAILKIIITMHITPNGSKCWTLSKCWQGTWKCSYSLAGYTPVTCLSLYCRWLWKHVTIIIGFCMTNNFLKWKRLRSFGEFKIWVQVSQAHGGYI